MINIVKHRRFLSYHLFTAMVVGGLLTVEDYFEMDDKEGIGDLILEFLLETPIFFAVSLALSGLVYLAVRALNRTAPWKTKPFRRFTIDIALVFAGVILFTSIVSLFVFLELVSFEDSKGSFFDYVGLTAIMLFITLFMVFAYHEFDAVFGEQLVLARRAEELEKQNVISRYEALKNQVNPHFLFNSLNTLSGLIYKNTEQADQFIRKFSEVFRYVLELNNNQLVTLQKELKFLDSYLYLQQIRHGDSIKVHKSIPAEYLNHQVPPMSLQILVENIFKHNVFTKHMPMDITLAVEQGAFFVKNIYRPRESEFKSTHIGQKNLFKRYELLAARGEGFTGFPEFYIEDDLYIVQLPIITPEHAESSHH